MLGASRILEKGPEYLRRQMERERESPGRGSAVERLAASKPQYVKSPQLVVGSSPAPESLTGIGSNSVSSHGSSNRSTNLTNNNNSNNNNHKAAVDTGDQRAPQEDQPVKRNSSKKRPDSLLLHRQKCEQQQQQQRESAGGSSKLNSAKRLLLNSIKERSNSSHWVQSKKEPGPEFRNQTRDEGGLPSHTGHKGLETTTTMTNSPSRVQVKEMGPEFRNRNPDGREFLSAADHTGSETMMTSAMAQKNTPPRVQSKVPAPEFRNRNRDGGGFYTAADHSGAAMTTGETLGFRPRAMLLLQTETERAKRRGRTVSRSHSDVSSRYSKNFANFDAFFKYCGLEDDVVDSLGKDSFSLCSLDATSVATSDDNFSRASGDSDGGLQEDELHETFRQGTSVIERNARVIKWLYSCRNAMQSGKTLRDLD